MKADIHPEYVPSHVRCTCGNEFWTRSTKPELHVEICSNCHPFYTGRQKLVDTGGRVERFRRRAARSRAARRVAQAAGAARGAATFSRNFEPARAFTPRMRFRLLTAALTTAALVAAASAAGAGRPPASVSLASCSVADHSAAFYARMKLVDGADRMALRFTLLERTGVEGDRAVKAPGLRRWRWSKPGVVSLRYRQGVRNLTENATYRAKVDFRWYSSSGAEVLRAQRRSPRCRQFVALPNLAARLTTCGRGRCRA